MEEWFGKDGFGRRGIGAGGHETALLSLAAALAGRGRLGLAGRGSRLRGEW